MSLYKEYIKEIEERKGEGLHPKPIDGGDLLSEIITQIKDENQEDRDASINFFIYNVLLEATQPSSSIW